MNSAIAVRVDDASSLKWAVDYPVQPTASHPAAIHLEAGDLPAWAPAVVDRLIELAALPTVDPAGSRPMNVEDVYDALGFLTRVMRDDTVAPWIGRLSSGGVQLTWRCGDVEVEAVFDEARDEQEVVVAVGDNEWEAPAREAESLFATVADRLSHLHLEHSTTA